MNGGPNAPTTADYAQAQANDATLMVRQLTRDLNELLAIISYEAVSLNWTDESWRRIRLLRDQLAERS